MVGSGNMDEQACIIDGLYRAVGLSAGGAFSPEDVRIIYQKVFHYPSMTNEVLVAMKKVAGKDEEWSCVGENILDVLLEMRKERERKEELYWSQQLLSMGQQTDAYLGNTQDLVSQQDPDSRRPRTHPRTSEHAQNAVPTGSDDRDLPRLEHRQRCALRLKRNARQCWARLVTEGVHSIGPGPRPSAELEVRGHALGWLTPADLLSLLEVKYDVITGMLYTEMLRQHYGPSAWETLLPWQQDKEKEGLEDLAELALGAGDLLRLTDLPGAFRIYKTCEPVFPVGSSASGVRSSWSAVNVLTEAYAARQQEKDSLTQLSKRLDRESLKLLFLYIRLATFRAQGEHRSHGALLAARQPWESWPRVSDAHRQEEVVSHWLHGDEEEKEEKGKQIFISASPQQAVLQLLVLKQKAERKYLVGLLRGVSLDQLQGQEKDNQRRGSLKDGCLRRLQQIRGSLRTHAPLEVLSAQAGGSSAESATRWRECAVVLLRQLMDVQEAQVSAVLPSLLHMSIERLQVLRDEYRSEFHAQHFANLLNILDPGVPESSPLEVGLVTTRMSHSEPITELNSNGGLHNGSSTDPEESAVASREEPEPRGVAEDVFQRPDLCTGCGAALEELPYLEILCVSDTTATRRQEGPATEGCHEEGEGGRGDGAPSRTPQGNVKQASLITLAWSKPAQCDAEATAVSGSEAECSVSVVVHGDEDDDGAGEAHCTTGIVCHETTAPDAVSHVDVLLEPPHPRSVTQPRSTVEMHISTSVETELTPPERNSQAHGFATETAEVAQKLSSEASNKPEMVEAFGDQAEVDVCSERWAETWDEKAPELPPAEEFDFPEQEAAVGARRRESNPAREPVSLVERERTMRNLVDMQRKVEMKQQRDRERQLLRVQERLSIIQNKKAEEDLLGLKQRETLEQLTHNLPQEDKIQQKTVVRARLEQLRRERSCIMQSKRDRNTAGFKELLAPVVHSTDTENSTE